MYLRYLTDDVFISILASIHKHREHMPSMMMLLSNGFPFNKDRSLLRRTTNHWMSSSKKAISEMALYCRYTHVYCSTTWMDLEWWSWEKSQWIISSLGWFRLAWIATIEHTSQWPKRGTHTLFHQTRKKLRAPSGSKKQHLSLKSTSKRDVKREKYFYFWV